MAPPLFISLLLKSYKYYSAFWIAVTSVFNFFVL